MVLSSVMFEGTQYMTVFFDDSDCALHKKKWVGESKGNKNLERKTAAKKT